MPRCPAPNPCLPQKQDIIPHVVKNLSLALLKMGKSLPRNMLSWSLEINKTVIVASRWFLFYLTYISCLVRLFSWQVGGKLSSLTFGTICWSLHNLSLYLLLKSQCECQWSQTIRQRASGFGFTGIYSKISEAETWGLQSSADCPESDRT